MENTCYFMGTRIFRRLFKNLNLIVKMNAKDTTVSNVKVICLKNVGKDEYREALTAACESLHGGKVIGVPTDTIYGVAASAQNSAGVRRLYEIKQRNNTNPVAISVADIDDVYRWGEVPVPRELLRDLLPGPVTVVLQRTPALNTELNPHTELVGVRIPDHDFIRDLSRTCDEPIALTSANISSQPSSISAEEFRHLWPHLDMVFSDDTHVDPSRLGSTVIDLSHSGHYTVIRPGSALEFTTSILQKYELTEKTTSTR